MVGMGHERSAECEKNARAGRRLCLRPPPPGHGQVPTAHHSSGVGAELYNVGITKCCRPWRRRG